MTSVDTVALYKGEVELVVNADDVAAYLKKGFTKKPKKGDNDNPPGQEPPKEPGNDSTKDPNNDTAKDPEK